MDDKKESPKLNDRLMKYSTIFSIFFGIFIYQGITYSFRKVLEYIINEAEK
jgi:hypothetical protein